MRLPRTMTVAFCVPCQARERIVVGGRCVVCGRRPAGSPEPTVLELAVASIELEGYQARLEHDLAHQ